VLHLPHLEILNLSGCTKLIDEDFEALKSCQNLAQLYVSFTSITSKTVVEICQVIDLIVLDTTSVLFPNRDRKSVLESSCGTLLYWYMSLNADEQESDLKELKDKFIDCCIKITRRF
jgi:hypothetical protein